MTKCVGGQQFGDVTLKCEPFILKLTNAVAFDIVGVAVFCIVERIV